MVKDIAAIKDKGRFVHCFNNSSVIKATIEGPFGHYCDCITVGGNYSYPCPGSKFFGRY